MTSSDSAEMELARWYTKARKFPQVVGKFHDGRPIWGGPYTYTQVFGGLGVLWFGSKTAGVWGQFGLVGNYVVLLGVAWLATFLLGRLPIGARNPLSILFGAYLALTAPPLGRCEGRTIRAPRISRSRDRISIGPSALPTDSSRDESTGRAVALTDLLTEPTPGRAATSMTTSGARSVESPDAMPGAGTRAPALTGVQRLLAANRDHQEV